MDTSAITAPVLHCRNPNSPTPPLICKMDDKQECPFKTETPLTVKFTLTASFSKFLKFFSAQYGHNEKHNAGYMFEWCGNNGYQAESEVCTCLPSRSSLLKQTFLASTIFTPHSQVSRRRWRQLVAGRKQIKNLDCNIKSLTMRWGDFTLNYDTFISNLTDQITFSLGTYWKRLQTVITIINTSFYAMVSINQKYIG